MKRFHIAAIAMACGLSACGGGGGNSEATKVSVSSVKVVGASLADSGTFGYKFTVRSASGAAPSVYSERIAGAFGKTLCNFFASGDGGTTWSTNAGCTNYAVAGSAINFGKIASYVFTTYPTAPTSQLRQLALLGAGNYAAGDLLVVGEGSANDTATLITGYLTDAGASGATTVFKQIINSLMNDSGATAGLGVLAADGGLAAGQAYMTKLAQTLAASIKTQALDKGAKRVVVLNTLDVTRTPKLAPYIAATPSLGPLFRAWVQAYNTALSSELAAYSDRVVIVDLYTGFNDELSNPTQFGLTNVSATVCDEVVNHNATTTMSTASSVTLATPSTVSACSDSAASAITPQHDAVNGTNWWKTYLFADNFHPTPYGHQLLGQLVAKRLTEAGWL